MKGDWYVPCLIFPAEFLLPCLIGLGPWCRLRPWLQEQMERMKALENAALGEHRADLQIIDSFRPRASLAEILSGTPIHKGDGSQ